MQQDAVARETSMMLPGAMSALTAPPATAHSLAGSSGHVIFSPTWNFWTSVLIFWSLSGLLKAHSPRDGSARCSPSAAPAQLRAQAAAHVHRARRRGARLCAPQAPAQPTAPHTLLSAEETPGQRARPLRREAQPSPPHCSPPSRSVRLRMRSLPARLHAG